MNSMRFLIILPLVMALCPRAWGELTFPPVRTFDDVEPAHRWFGTTDLLRERTITVGCRVSPLALYCPHPTQEVRLTRAMLATLIIRSIYSGRTGDAEGFYASTSPYFTDVGASHGSFRYIQKMKELGITAGCTATTFCPDDLATNHAVAVFTVRARYVRDSYYGDPVPEGWQPSYSAYPQRFYDVWEGHSSFMWVQRAYDLVGPEMPEPENGGNFNPDSEAHRGPLSFYLAYGILGSPPLPPSYQGGAYSWMPGVAYPLNCGLNAGPSYYNQVFQVTADAYYSESYTWISPAAPDLWVSGLQTKLTRSGATVFDSQEVKAQTEARYRYPASGNASLVPGNYLQTSTHRVGSGACNVLYPPSAHQTTTWPASGQAAYLPVVYTVASSPPGLALTVDGAPCASPCSYNWTVGSSHTIAAASPQSGGTGVQYVFSNWSDGGGISHQITAPSTSATYTASFTTQYYLTTAVSPAGTGSIAPGSGWYNNGAVVNVSAGAYSGYAFTGFSGALSGTGNPQALGMNGPKSVTANFVAGAIHTVTTSPSGLTVTVDGANCTGVCSYLWPAGTQHTLAVATPQACGSAQCTFARWSDGGAVSHVVTASAGGGSYTASFHVPPVALPALLKGVTYFPRGHAWYRMLYDWYGSNLSSVVASDFQKLKANGVNFIHLFVWDQAILQAHGLTVPGPGFHGASSGLEPATSPNNQWGALDAFVSLAEANNLWVNIHFAASVSPQGTASGQQYAQWVNKFVNYLNAPTVPGGPVRHQNILIWGVLWPHAGPYNTDPNDPSVLFWKAMYGSILQTVSGLKYPSGRALLAVDADWQFVGPESEVAAQLGGYQWWWELTKKAAYNLDAVLGAGHPDLFNFQMWNANNGDLENNVKCVTGAAQCPCSPCLMIPASKILVTEFGAGTSLENEDYGMRLASYGDKNQPTMTLAGQDRYIKNILCAFSRLGITKFVYHGFHDSKSTWVSDFNFSGQTLAWNGFWGLSPEDASKPDKPALATFGGYAGACQVSGPPYTPVVALQNDPNQNTEDNYYVVGDTAKVTYTAADATSLALDVPFSLPAQSCDESHAFPLLPGASLVGSCAFTKTIMTLGRQKITLTGTNGVGGPSSSYDLPVVVGTNPRVTGLKNHNTGQECRLIDNPGCTLTARQTDIVEIYGAGFEPNGGNEVRFSGAYVVTLGEDTGLLFHDNYRGQINAQLGDPGLVNPELPPCPVAPGSWVLSVRNPNSGTFSTGVTINVTAGSGCP